MSGDQAKSTPTAVEQATHPPVIPQYPPQPFPGAPYPPPPGAYTWYYPPPPDPNGDPIGPPPWPYVMFPPPGIMYGYPPPPSPAQGTSHVSHWEFHRYPVSVLSLPNNPPPSPRLWAILGSHACRDHTCKAQAGQDGGMSRVFPTCLSVTLTDVSVISARIVRPPVSGATTHARASDVKSMVSQIRVWTACVRPERLESSAVRTNVKANLRLQKRLRIQVSSSHTAEILSHVSHIS